MGSDSEVHAPHRTPQRAQPAGTDSPCTDYSRSYSRQYTVHATPAFASGTARLPHATAYTGVHTHSHSYTICILQKKIQFLQNFSTHGHSPHLSAPVSPLISFTFTDTVHDSINKQISLEPGEVLELLPSHHNSKTIPRFPMAPRL